MSGIIATQSDTHFRVTVKGSKLHELLDMRLQRMSAALTRQRERLVEAERQAAEETEAEQEMVKARQRLDRRRAGIAAGMTQAQAMPIPGEVDLLGYVGVAADVRGIRNAIMSIEIAVAEMSWLRSTIDADGDYTLSGVDLRTTFGGGQVDPLIDLT